MVGSLISANMLGATDSTAVYVTRAIVWTLPFIIGMAGYQVKRFIDAVDKLSARVGQLDTNVGKLGVEVHNWKEVTKQQHEENLEKFRKLDP